MQRRAIDSAEEFYAAAFAQVGKRYIFGHEVRMDDPSPRAFDCSELVEWMFHGAGIRIPDGSYNQEASSVPVNSRELITGDLFFHRNRSGRVHHVGLYVGHDLVVEARGRAYGVISTPLDKLALRWAAEAAPAPTPTKPPQARKRYPLKGHDVYGKKHGPQDRHVRDGYATEDRENIAAYIQAGYNGWRELNPGGSKPAPLETDGYFGQLTTDAVMEFQRRKKFKTDGLVGPRTWPAISRYATRREGDE
jgi:hypothetical protein